MHSKTSLIKLFSILTLGIWQGAYATSLTPKDPCNIVSSKTSYSEFLECHFVEDSETWSMPETKELTPDQHKHVESLLLQTSKKYKSYLYDFMSTYFFKKRHPEYLMRDAEAFMTKVLSGKSEETLRLFLQCVDIASESIPLLKATLKAKYPEDPTNFLLDSRDLAIMMRSLDDFPLNEQYDAVQKAVTLFEATEGFHVDGYSEKVWLSDILATLKQIPSSKREAVYKASLALSSLAHDPIKLLMFLKPLDAEALPSFVSFILNLDKMYKGCVDVERKSRLPFLSSENRPLFLETLRPFMAFTGMNQKKYATTPDLKEKLFDERKNLVRILGSLSEDHLVDNTLWDDTLTLRARAFKASSSKDSQDILGYADLVETLANVPSEQRKVVMDEVIEIIEETQWGEKTTQSPGVNNQIAKLVAIVHEIRQKNPHIYREYLQDMLNRTNNKNTWTRIHLLKFLNKNFLHLNDVEMGALVRRMSQILPYVLTDDTCQYESDASVKLSHRIHTSFRNLDDMMPLLDLPMDQSNKKKLVGRFLEVVMPQPRVEGVFVHVREIDREEFLNALVQLCKLPIKDPNYKLIIDYLASVPADTRLDRVDQLVTFNKDIYEMNDFHEVFGPIHLDRHWLDHQGQEVLGTNVHEEDRDQKMTDALKTLIEHQGHMSTETLSQNLSACKKYIAEGDFTEEQKRQALNALEGKRTQGGWDSLLSQSASPAFASLDGLGLVGRLWHFANHFEDPRVPHDAENARRAFVMACAQSSDADGFMVCNLGKVQRIVCGVLQGRLQNVSVDQQAQDIIPSSQKKNEVDETLNDDTKVGQSLAALYLQTLKDQKLPRTEAGMCSAAASWLRAQGGEYQEEIKQVFFEDVKSFYALMADAE